MSFRRFPFSNPFIPSRTFWEPDPSAPTPTSWRGRRAPCPLPAHRLAAHHRRCCLRARACTPRCRRPYSAAAPAPRGWSPPPSCPPAAPPSPPGPLLWSPAPRALYLTITVVRIVCARPAAPEKPRHAHAPNSLPNSLVFFLCAPSARCNERWPRRSRAPPHPVETAERSTRAQGVHLQQRQEGQLVPAPQSASRRDTVVRVAAAEECRDRRRR